MTATYTMRCEEILFLFSRGGLACETEHVTGIPPICSNLGSIHSLLPKNAIYFHIRLIPGDDMQTGMVVDGSVMIWTRIRDVVHDV